MSDAPEEKQPWPTFQAKPGVARPRVAVPFRRLLPQQPAPPVPALNPAAKPVARPAVRPMPIPAARPAGADSPVAPPANPAAARPDGRPEPWKVAGGRAPAVSDELAAALAKLAIEYAPLPLTSAPFVSVKQKEAEARERRRLRRRWLAKLVVGLIVVSGALHVVATKVLFRLPPHEVLEAEVAKAAQVLVLLYSSGDRPLEIARAVPVLRDNIDSSHLRYTAEVTLRLRQPLYGPALTNGTLSYRMLQESLARAREQKLKNNLFPLNDGPKPPVLPRLIQVVHRAGEFMVVRVVFEAEQFGWRWRIKPAQLANRTVDRQFEGAKLDRYNDAPYLIFGLPETMPEIRERTRAAGAFVTAVAKEVQRHANVEAVVEAPKVEPAPTTVANARPADGSRPQIDPNKPAVEPDEPRPQIDPNKPAVEADGPRPPIDPNKPAVEPEKPPKPDRPPGTLR